MGFLGDIFNIAFYQPLLWALMFLYQYLPGNDFGVAVISLTVLVKLALYPLGTKGIQSQRAMQEIQPKIQEIREKFKNDQAKQAQETMALYKKEKINPFSGFILLLVQLPILFALFRIFWEGVDGLEVNPMFLGVINLAQTSAVLVILAGIAQFWQVKMVSGQASQQKAKQTTDFGGMMQKQMLYFSPIFTIFILWRMPSAIALYWLATSLFTIGQQFITLKKYDSDRHREN